MSKYRIIWIDDEWDEQIPFITWCRDRHSIEIIPFKTSKEGMIALESNIDSWDAIILDVEVYHETEHEVPSPKGFQNSINKISSLEYKRKIPYFISTGKDAIKNNLIFLSQYDKVYIKGDDDDELIKQLKIKADAQLETQIRHKYNDLFSWIPLSEELLKILMYIESNSIYDVACFNEVRKMLEWVRNLCIERGMLPDSIKELNKFSRFLCDEKMKDNVPVYIQRSLHSCIVVSQEGSHLLTIDKAMKNGETPYLLRSTVFELLNVLYWCKSLPNDADSIEAMRSKVASLTVSIQDEETKEVIEGVVEQDANRNYHCGEYLLPYSNGESVLGKTIKIVKHTPNDKMQTKFEYPYFVQKFEILG